MRSALALAFVLSLAAPAGLQAQEASAEESTPSNDDIARAHFVRGREAYREGRFATALSEYETAHALSPQPALLYNIANAHDRLGHAEAALEHYRSYLVELPDAANRGYTESRINVLEEQVGAQRAESREPDESESREGTAPASAPSSAAPVAPIILFGVAGVAGIAGIVTGIAALTLRGDLEDDCPMLDCDASMQPDLDRMDALALAADVLFGVSAASAIAAIILLLGDGESSESTSASVGCGPHGCLATLRGTLPR